MARKVIITCALTGNFHGKELNPNHPEQPAEIAQAAYDAYNAGAAIAHMHARDKDGKATNDPKVFTEIGELLTAKCNIITQFSTAPAKMAAGVAEEGVALLYADDAFLPEMCSLDCSLIGTTWKENIFIHEWTRPFLIKHAARMKELGIKPELEMFNPTSIEDVVNYVYPEGVFEEPLSMTFVMGMDKASQQAMAYSVENLVHVINKVPKGSLFTTMAIARNQMPATMMSMLMGGNVRVGFEDNVYFNKGELARDNAQLVERMARYVREFGYEVATPDEAREMLGLKKK